MFESSLNEFRYNERSPFCIIIKITFVQQILEIMCIFGFACQSQFEVKTCYTGTLTIAEQAWASRDLGEV